jgi:hypothetical protein
MIRITQLKQRQLERLRTQLADKAKQATASAVKTPTNPSASF